MFFFFQAEDTKTTKEKNLIEILNTKVVAK